MKGSYLQLRALAKAKAFSSFKDCEKVTHAFISARLDNCSSLFVGVSLRVHFKIVLFIYESVNGLAPSYLPELVMPYNSLRSLRSSGQSLLVAPQTRWKLSKTAPSQSRAPVCPPTSELPPPLTHSKHSSRPTSSLWHFTAVNGSLLHKLLKCLFVLISACLCVFLHSTLVTFCCLKCAI